MLRSGHIALALLWAAASCTSPSESNQHTPGIHLLAGSGVTDTIQAELVQALVVRVIPSRSGIVVRFEHLGGAAAPFVLVSPLEGAEFQTLMVDTTDASGKASARIKLGTRAGPARLRIVVPEHGYIDSASYSILPGTVSSVRLMPRDTTLRIGRTFTLRGGATDRFGNDRIDPIGLTAEHPQLAISGRVVTATGSGRGRIIGTFGSVADTVFVGIVPEGIISAIFDGVLVLRTDGSNLVKLSAGLSPGWGADWSPDGQLLAFDNPQSDRLRILDATGVPHNLTPGASWELYPKFSADGQWLYYSTYKPPWEIRRVHLDGSGDELVVGNQGDLVAPAPSPDGTRMAYVFVGPDQLRMRNLATGIDGELDLNGHTPAWSPNGDWIAYNATGFGRGLYIISPSGTGKRRVSTPGVSYVLGIDWSPDGRWLIARADRGTIDLIEVTTGFTISLPFAQGWGAPAWKQ